MCNPWYKAHNWGKWEYIKTTTWEDEWQVVRRDYEFQRACETCCIFKFKRVKRRVGQ